MLKHYSAIIAFIRFFMLPATTGSHGRIFGPSCVDPSVIIVTRDKVTLDKLVYVSPFSTLRAGSDENRSINIGNKINVQDIAEIDATQGSIEIGEKLIIAHGRPVKGPAIIGAKGTYPNKGRGCP